MIDIDYNTILPKGKKNAISAKELAEKLGFPSVRVLQKNIEKARAEGVLILSSTTGGYYLPENDAEIEEFVATLRSRAIGIFKAIKAARQYMNETKGQMSFKDVT